MASAKQNEKIGRRSERLLFFSHILHKIFLEDWALKLIALVITIALWLGVTGLSTPTAKGFTVPLNFGISNNSEITFSSAQEVDVVVSGDKRKIEQINRTDLTASIDLTDVAPGNRVISLTTENVSVVLPVGIKLDEIRTERVAVRIESVEEKDVAVRADILGKPAEGFEVYGETITPGRIRVRGPASSIKTLDSIATDSIDITGAQNDIVARQVRVSDPTVAVLNTVVDVSVRIGERRVERRFSIASASGKRVSVVLFGPESILNNIEAKDLRVEIVKNENDDDSARLALPETLQSTVEVRTIRIQQ